MDNAGVLIPLLGITCGLVAIISSAYLKSQKMKLDMAQANRASSASEAEMMSELQRLKDRVAVLERLATDGDRKLAGEIERRILDGIYQPGEKLPSIRRLHQQTNLSISTVYQAYVELENTGDAAVSLDLIYAQDLGLAAFPGLFLAGRIHHQRRGGARLLLATNCPRIAEQRLRSFSDAGQVLPVECRGLDGEPLSHGLKQEKERLFADRRGRQSQGDWAVGEHVFVGNQVLQGRVSGLNQAKFFEIGVCETPPAPLIDPNAMRQHAGERRPGVGARNAFGCRIEHPLEAQRFVLGGETEGVLDPPTKLIGRQALVARALHGHEDGRSQQGDKKEVVKVTGLKSRVLTVVGKAQQLPLMLHEAVGAVHPAQGAGDQ